METEEELIEDEEELMNFLNEKIRLYELELEKLTNEIKEGHIIDRGYSHQSKNGRKETD